MVYWLFLVMYWRSWPENDGCRNVESLSFKNYRCTPGKFSNLRTQKNYLFIAVTINIIAVDNTG